MVLDLRKTDFVVCKTALVIRYMEIIVVRLVPYKITIFLPFTVAEQAGLSLT